MPFPKPKQPTSSPVAPTVTVQQERVLLERDTLHLSPADSEIFWGLANDHSPPNDALKAAFKRMQQATS